MGGLVLVRLGVGVPVRDCFLSFRCLFPVKGFLLFPKFVSGRGRLGFIRTGGGRGAKCLSDRLRRRCVLKLLLVGMGCVHELGLSAAFKCCCFRVPGRSGEWCGSLTGAGFLF